MLHKPLRCLWLAGSSEHYLRTAKCEVCHQSPSLTFPKYRFTKCCCVWVTTFLIPLRLLLSWFRFLLMGKAAGKYQFRISGEEGPYLRVNFSHCSAAPSSSSRHIPAWASTPCQRQRTTKAFFSPCVKPCGCWYGSVLMGSVERVQPFRWQWQRAGKRR